MGYSRKEVYHQHQHHRNCKATNRTNNLPTMMKVAGSSTTIHSQTDHRPSSHLFTLFLLTFLGSVALLSQDWMTLRSSSTTIPITLSSQIPLIPEEEVKQVDIVYVYCNKTHPRVYEEYNQLLQQTSNMTSRGKGFEKSKPSQTKSIDLDLMERSLRSTLKMAQNLGNIHILVTFPEEISEQVRDLPKVQVVLSQHLYDGVYFSSNAAESVIHRIPNLSNLYIAMNDDMIFTKPIDLRRLFFTPNGSPRTMHGVDQRIESIEHLSKRLTGPQYGGAKPQLAWTCNRLTRFRDVQPLQALYPSHVPRPFNRDFIKYVERIDPDLFQSVFSTRFRCQKCLNIHLLSLLHSYEAGALRISKDHAFVAYIDSPNIWKKVVQKWNKVISITLQEVEPSMHATVLEFLDRQLNDEIST